MMCMCVCAVHVSATYDSSYVPPPLFLSSKYLLRSLTVDERSVSFASNALASAAPAIELSCDIGPILETRIAPVASSSTPRTTRA